MILIVEDEALFSQSLAEMLDGFGKRIIITTDGDQALEKIEKYHYSLAVIDLVLPGPLNGLEVIKKIKMHTPSTKIIAISGYGNQSLIQKSYKAGADVFLAKPFRPVELIDQVERLLFHRTTKIAQKETSQESSPEPQAAVQSHPQPAPKPAKPEPPVIARPQVNEAKPVVKTKPAAAQAHRVDNNTVPEIFKNFPQSALVDLVKFGKIIRMNPGQRLKVNYTEYIVIVVAGSVAVYYGPREIGILELNESIGQESLTKDITPELSVSIEARKQSKLFLISKVQLIRYLSNNSESLLNTFKNNLKLSLKKNIILKSEKHQEPEIPATGNLTAPPEQTIDPPEEPDIDIDLDRDSLDMLGI